MTSRGQRQKGMALVEVLTAIVAGSALIGGLGAVVHRIYRANEVAGQHLEEVVGIARLGEQLRRDAHEAIGERIERAEDASPRLLFDDPTGRQVVYELGPKTVYRTVRAGDQAVAREAFGLGDWRPVDWTEGDSSARRIGLTLEHRDVALADNPVPAVGRRVMLEARIGPARRIPGAQP